MFNAWDRCINNAFFDENTQNLNCSAEGQFQACVNQAVGNNNNQNLDCENGAFRCGNRASGSNNNQNLNCKDNELIFCDNSVGVQGDRNNMDLRCKNISGDDRTNFVLEGNDNTQNLDCESVGASGCINRVLVIVSNPGNTKRINCKFVFGGCENTTRGNGNVQDLNCIRSTQCTNEINTPTDGNTQKTVCVNSGTWFQ